MIVCSGGKPDGGRIIFIGISIDELRMLVSGGAVEIDLAQQGLEGTAILFGGENNADLLSVMQPMMSERTVIVEQDAPIYGVDREPLQ